MATRFIIVGLGHFGAGVATSLHGMGHEVAAIDLDAARVDRLADRLEKVLRGDGTDPEVLLEAGAKGADAAIVSTGGDVTASVLAAISLRDLGVENIHVKVVSDLHCRILAKVGVTSTAFPERESALHLARRVGDRAILRYVELEPGLSAQEMRVPGRWAGKTLRELDLPRRHRISVIAVRRPDEEASSPVPDPDRPLHREASLLVAGRDEDLERVTALV